MKTGSLGKEFVGGEIIVRQGDEGDCMFVIMEGEVEVLSETDGKLVRLAVLEKGDFFGEMAMFQKEVRTATVRAMTETRLLTIDKKTFLSRVEEDPSLAFRIVETLSRRVHRLSVALVGLKN